MRKALSPEDIEAIRLELEAGQLSTATLAKAEHAIAQMQKHIAMYADSYGKERKARMGLEADVGEDAESDKDARITELEGLLAEALEGGA